MLLLFAFHRRSQHCSFLLCLVKSLLCERFVDFGPSHLALPQFCQLLFLLPQQGSELGVGVLQRRVALYGAVRTQVELQMEYLLQRRGDDPYDDFVKRLAYESLGSVAPTFSVDE